MSQYNVPDKATGDTWAAAEHNMLKFAHNDTDSRVVSLEASQATQTAQINANSAGITGNDTDIAALQAEQVTQNGSIAAATTAAAAATTAAATNAVDIGALQAGQAAQDTAIAGNDADIATLQAGQAAQDASITANNAAIVSNDADIAGLQTGQAAQDTAVAANTAAAAANATQAGTNAAAIATLNAKGEPLGAWDADTNTPDLTTAPTKDNDWYIVDVAGSTTINGQSTWAVGDVVRAEGGAWVQVKSSESDGSGAGTDSVRDSSTTQSNGATWFSTDSGNTTIWDGSAWRPVTGIYNLFDGFTGAIPGEPMRLYGEDMSLLSDTATTASIALASVDPIYLTASGDKYFRISVVRDATASSYALIRWVELGGGGTSTQSRFMFSQADGSWFADSLNGGTVPELISSEVSNRYCTFLIRVPQDVTNNRMQLLPTFGPTGSFGTQDNTLLGQLVVADLDVYDQMPIGTGSTLSNQNLPRFSGTAAADAALPAAPADGDPGTVHLWVDTSDGNTIKARI